MPIAFVGIFLNLSVRGGKGAAPSRVSYALPYTLLASIEYINIIYKELFTPFSLGFLPNVFG